MSDASREIENFAIELARELSGAFPASEGVREQQSMARLARAIDRICNRAASYQKEKKLGMFGRAKVGTAFKLELEQAGYPAGFVDDVTRQLLLVMSGN